MASVTLKNIKKVYPLVAGERKNSNLSVTARGVLAVDNFNLEVNDKEFIVLVGPSGCGKSTTLRMIAGLEEISSGDLYIDDIRVNDFEPKDRDVAMVFQNYALYPHMTVYENMAFALRRRIKNKSQIDEKVRETAEILGISQYLDRKPKNLSGGQRQRVAIGRAIVRNPKIMLMDEPLSNLDTNLRNQMRAELITLRKRINTTFIYVTHDQTEAMTLGDRIVIMKDGVIQQIGTPQQVFDNPINIFVAGFIGTPQMNFFDAQIEKDSDRYKIIMGNFHTYVSDEQNAILTKNAVKSGNIVLGVRPESLQITTDKKSFGAQVGVMEMMGSSVFLHLHYKDKKAVMVTQMLGSNGRLKMDYEIGSTLNFRFDPQAMYLFDKETGNSIIYQDE